MWAKNKAKCGGNYKYLATKMNLVKYYLIAKRIYIAMMDTVIL